MPFASLRAPVGGFSDKKSVLRLRKQLQKLEVEEIFTRPDTTAQARLEEAGFSDRMIDRFFRPLFSGIALDPSLSFSSRSLEFVFRMLAEGDAAVPARGMGEIPTQLAARLPAGTIRYGATVEEVRDHHVVVDGEKLEANAVVVATDAADAARLTHDESEDPGALALTTWWLVAPGPPVHRPVIVLDAEPRSPVNNLAVMSQIAPTYSPDDRALIAVSTPLGRRVRDRRPPPAHGDVRLDRRRLGDPSHRSDPAGAAPAGGGGRSRSEGAIGERAVRGRRSPPACLDQRRAHVRSSRRRGCGRSPLPHRLLSARTSAPRTT